MSRRLECMSVRKAGCAPALRFGLLNLSLCLGATGCLGSLNQRGVAVAAATAPVIDQAEAAYRGAQKLHDLKVNYETADTFEKTQTVDKAAIVQFPSDQAIQVRLTVLEALKSYVDSVVEITSGVRSPQLEASAKSVGSSLSAIGNTLAPTLEDVLELAPPTSTSTTTYTTAGKSTTTSATVAAPLVTTAAQSAVSTAVLALGEYLVSRTVKRELPARLKTMDGVVEALSTVLEDDIATLQEQERRDLDAIYNSQTLFLQSPEGRKLDAAQRRVLMLQLPDLVRQQHATEQQLSRLRGSLRRLYLTHHALAVDAQNSNAESFQAKLRELAAAGSDLGKFYSSLPSK